ncbi:hypothetical protein [Ferruginibacter albus]|uniref:hypothetical protein n=1 Tax=Ferruginibacter albus TaxID=2875540 RepID=UPI001CC40177|nr:hypothetical protein [Ferruginibacter albus]UAY53502.1 hypothetical protein K9M53_07460 [Ferruginibacter albus]
MKRWFKFLKWFSLSILFLLVCGLIFRGFLYRHFFFYKTISQRSTYSVSDKKLISYIDSASITFKPESIKDIIDFSLKLTAEKLQFKEAKNENDPNKLITSNNAHCVGYAAFFSAICNYLLQKFNFNEDWHSIPLVGQIYFCGINIHPFIHSSFYKDHDFDVIENKKTGEKYYTDPTINDYLKINYVTGS